MLLDCASLPLTPFWERENAVVLVPRFDALCLRSKDSYQEMSEDEALSLFDSMEEPPSAWDIRDFVSEAGLTRSPLGEISDRRLHEMIRQAIGDGNLVALRKGDKAGKATRETALQRQLVKQVEQQTRGQLSYAGRQYKLVADVDLSKLPSRNSYEVVSREDAKRVLDGQAKQAGATGELGTLLGKASEKLTPDWRPPLQPDGLILLRRIAVASALIADQGPALTPSQMRKTMLTWIAVEFVDDEDEPWDGAADITLADGSQRTVQLSGEGAIGLEEIEPGTVKVKFPGLTTDTDT